MGAVMSLRRTLLAAAAVAALVPAASRAEGIEGRWSLSFQGDGPRVSGNVHEGGRTVSPCPRTSRPGPSRRPRPELRSQASIGTASAEERGLVRGSSQDVSSTLRSGRRGRALNADFADYKEWGAEIGYRYYFQADQPFKPYLARGAAVPERAAVHLQRAGGGVVLTTCPSTTSHGGRLRGRPGLPYDLSGTSPSGSSRPRDSSPTSRGMRSAAVSTP